MTTGREVLRNDSRLQRGLALPLAAYALYGAWTYPVAGSTLAAGVVVLLAVCLRWPAAWLGALPLLLPTLDLTPWSGRLFFQEIDFFLLAALGACLWHGQFRPARRARFPLGIGALVTAFALAYAVSLYLGLAPFPPLGANAFSSYYSHYNALRVARGVLWALIFLPPLCLLFRRDRTLARSCLLGGAMLGLLGTACAVLWERGVLHDLLYGDNRYARLQGLLDFSTPYRITGLLSSMHTGGESIDGYLALTWPCALVAILLKPVRRSLLVLGLITLPLGLYASVVTFSRASYLALLVSMLLFAGGFYVSLARRAGLAGASVPLAGTAGLLAACGLGFTHGGVLALGATLAGFVIGAVTTFANRPRSPAAMLALMAALIAGTAALIYHAQLTSKWVATAPASAISLAWGLAVAGVCTGLLTGRFSRRSLDLKEFGAAATLVVAIAATLIPAALGYRMESRFSEATRDIETRRAHWRDGLALSPDTLLARIFGMGLGAFPRRYMLQYPEKLDGLSVLTQEGFQTQLQITGGKDVKITQRVSLPAFQPYVVRLKYRLSADEGNLRIRVCRRHLINPTEYNGACREFARYVHSTEGTWQMLEFPFDIGELGVHAGDLGRAPLLIEITNRREYRLMEKPPVAIEFDDIELRDARGHDYIRNGTFSDGMDHWFALYDFNHLPWHAKNMFVHLYVEQGFLGLGGFLLLFASVLRRGLKSALGGDLFAFGLTVALCGFLAIGTVGTMFDEPRVMLWCFLLMFSVVANAPPPPAQRTAGHHRVSNTASGAAQRRQSETPRTLR